ncbi:MAG: hypothetical protein ACFFBD_26780, partial [Candidatus Hodarchaeota archaeon]
GNPSAYVAIVPYEGALPEAPNVEDQDTVGLYLHVPKNEFLGVFPERQTPESDFVPLKNAPFHIPLVLMQIEPASPSMEREIIQKLKEIGIEGIGSEFKKIDENVNSIKLLVNDKEKDLDMAIVKKLLVAEKWIIRGENLLCWEQTLRKPLEEREVAIDPVNGRILIAVETKGKADSLKNGLYLTFTYGAVGDVGAHPISLKEPLEWTNEPFRFIQVSGGNDKLENILVGLHTINEPTLVEIQDSLVYDLQSTTFGLKKPLYIRAAKNQRPIIRLSNSFEFFPIDFANLQPEKDLNVYLEGLYLARGSSLAVNEPLIARTALNKLQIIHCTLDPGGYKRIDGSRAEIFPSMELDRFYGYVSVSIELESFGQIPEIVLENSISGPLFIDTNYFLSLKNSIIDAGKGVNEFAITGVSPRIWGPPTKINGITIFGKTQVEWITGKGAIFVHPLRVQKTLKGCLRYSYIAGDKREIPQIEGCIFAHQADPRLRFVSTIFGQPEYGQLAHGIDYQIRERGPNDNAMGAFGYLLEANKWRNINIRYREFMPVGIIPVFIVVT